MTDIIKESKIILCRVCLCSQEDEYMSLFEKYKCFRIFEYINIFSDVHIQESDGFPDNICKTCFLSLETAINFKEKCENSNILLRTQDIKNCLPVKWDGNEKLLIVKSEIKNIALKLELDNEQYFETTSYGCELPNDAENINENIEIIDKLDGLLTTEKKISQVQCHDCGDLFKSKCKLRVHWKKTHMFSSLICSICKRMFKSYKAMQMHKKKKSLNCLLATDKNIHIEGEGKLRLFKCKECGYKTRRPKDMGTHLRVHSGEKPYQCDKCPKKFSQQSSLQAHQENCHKEYVAEITCQICGKVIKGRSKMNRHIRLHKQARIKCPVCKKLLCKQYLKSHLQRHSGIKSYTCELCAAAFYTIAELCNHKRISHKKGQVKKCPKCEYNSRSSFLLKRHLSKHTDNNYPCAVCGRFYLSLEKLLTHKKLHIEKTKPCPLCNKVFLHEDSVRKHMAQTHIRFEDKIHPCPVCAKMFLNKCSIQKHMSQKHPGKKKTAKSNSVVKQNFNID